RPPVYDRQRLHQVRSGRSRGDDQLVGSALDPVAGSCAGRGGLLQRAARRARPQRHHAAPGDPYRARSGPRVCPRGSALHLETPAPYDTTRRTFNLRFGLGVSPRLAEDGGPYLEADFDQALGARNEALSTWHILLNFGLDFRL